MLGIAGAYGNSNRDEHLNPKAVDQTSQELNITWSDGSTRSLPIPDDVSKITFPEIPEDFPRNVRTVLPGGGGVNSRIAAGIVAEDAGAKNEIRYLDANRGDGLIKNKLPSPARWLELRDSPRNYVLGDRDDKRIFRSPVGAADPLGEKQFGDIAWLCEAQTILLNSPKDQEPVRAIFEQRSRRGFDVIFVLTPSLPKAGCTPGSKGSDWCVGRITVPHRWESGVDQWRGVGSGTATQDGVGRGDSRDHGQTRSVVHGGRLSRTYSY